MRAFTTFVFLTGAFVAGPAGWAAEVSGPEGAVATHSADIDDGQYALPIRSFTTPEPTVTLTGRIIRRAWRTGTDRPVSAIISDYRNILAEAGYTTVLDCAGHACGGFDFRFGADLLPPPDMAMDVSEFQQLTVGRENPANYVSVLVSKVRDQIFVQIVTAMPKDPGMALIEGDATRDTAASEGRAGQADAVAKRDDAVSIKDDADKAADGDSADASVAETDGNADPRAIDLAADDVSKGRPNVEVETEPETAAAENGSPEPEDAATKDTVPAADPDDAKDADVAEDVAVNTDTSSPGDDGAGSNATNTAADDAGSDDTADATDGAPESDKSVVAPKDEDDPGTPVVTAERSDDTDNSDGTVGNGEGDVPSTDTDTAETGDVATADTAADETYVGPRPRPDWILRLGSGEEAVAPDDSGTETTADEGSSDETGPSEKEEPKPEPTAASTDEDVDDTDTKDASLFDRLTKHGHVVVDGLLFESGGATLSEASTTALDEMASLMTENPKLRFAIVGHSDNVGPLDVNIKISRRRAEAVRRAMIRRGIASNRLVARGVGFLSPRRSNATEEGRAMNRRVELVLGEPIE